MRIAVPLLIAATILIQATFVRGQDEKKLLATKGWGSLSGKITKAGDIPTNDDLTAKMMAHADKSCCLAKDARAEEKIEGIWIVDPKTKAVANVIVWLKPPAGTYFPLPPNYKPNKTPVVIDQPHCAFLPRIAVCHPVDIINGKEVLTGQTVQFKNSATVSHNVRAIGLPDKEKNSFNVNLPAGSTISKTFEAQRLPISVQCDVHNWMAGKLAVFDHPYFAISNDKGEFSIPEAPAGAEVSLIAWHEGVGWVLPELGKGRPITLKEGKNTIDLTVK